MGVTLKYMYKGELKEESYNFSDEDTKTISDLCYR